MSKLMPKLIAVLLTALCVPAIHAAEYCGELKSSFGPFDYTNSEDRKNLQIVEQAHFTPSVENLVKGSSSSVGDDLSYTLAAFPNHHRALASMAALSIKKKTARPVGTRYSVPCYFDRAIRFRPRDGMVRLVYGSYLAQLGEVDKAMEQLEEAVKLEPDNANINYNLGLLHLKKKDYEQAVAYAKKAYALGFPLPGLKNKLAEAGKWNN